MNDRRPVVIAHRGDPSRGPENTLACLRLALEAEPDYIEVDVHRSGDGHLVVIHDRTLRRTTTGSGEVSECTLAELRRLDAGSWYGEAFAGEPVPTLSEALAAVTGPSRLLVELKGEGTGQAVAAVIGELGELGPAFVSFRPQEIQALRDGLPGAEVRLLAPEAMFQGEDLARLFNLCEKLGSAGLAVSGRNCSAEVAEEIHRRGLDVWVGATNEEQQWSALLESGVDGLISDRPGELVQFLRQRGVR